jgi:hypothetical protein
MVDTLLGFPVSELPKVFDDVEAALDLESRGKSYEDIKEDLEDLGDNDTENSELLRESMLSGSEDVEELLSDSVPESSSLL